MRFFFIKKIYVDIYNWRKCIWCVFKNTKIHVFTKFTKYCVFTKLQIIIARYRNVQRMSDVLVTEKNVTKLHILYKNVFSEVQSTFWGLYTRKFDSCENCL